MPSAISAWTRARNLAAITGRTASTVVPDTSNAATSGSVGAERRWARAPSASLTPSLDGKTTTDGPASAITVASASTTGALSGSAKAASETA